MYPRVCRRLLPVGIHSCHKIATDLQYMIQPDTCSQILGLKKAAAYRRRTLISRTHRTVYHTPLKHVIMAIEVVLCEKCNLLHLNCNINGLWGIQ